MYTCGACGGKHTSAQEGKACYARSKSPEAAQESAAKKSTVQESPAKKSTVKKKGQKRAAKKQLNWHVKASERPGSARPRVQSTRPGDSPSSPAKNQAAPKTEIPSGSSQEPQRPPQPATNKKKRSSKSRRTGEVWQPPSKESKEATPGFDKENRDDYV
jgi:hypothetical protein